LLTDGHVTFSGHADTLVGLGPSSVASMLGFGAVALLLLRRRYPASVGRP
jgi:hypothetical protein